MYRLMAISKIISKASIRKSHLNSTICTRINRCAPIFLKQYHESPKTPDLVYIPKLGRWLNCKLKLKLLKLFYDRDFHEGEFIYGSIRAICCITEIINKNKINELNGLLTDIGRLRLINDMKNLTPLQKEIIYLKPEDIKIMIPLQVQMGPNKICRITLRVLGVKWYQHINGIYKLALVTIQSQFVRNYKLTPEWTIAHFRIIECTILDELINR